MLLLLLIDKETAFNYWENLADYRIHSLVPLYSAKTGLIESQGSVLTWTHLAHLCSRNITVRSPSRIISRMTASLICLNPCLRSNRWLNFLSLTEFPEKEEWAKSKWGNYFSDPWALLYDRPVLSIILTKISSDEMRQDTRLTMEMAKATRRDPPERARLLETLIRSRN